MAVPDSSRAKLLMRRNIAHIPRIEPPLEDIPGPRRDEVAVGEPRPGNPLVLALPRRVDAQGRLYTRTMGMGGGAYPDSARAP